MRDPARSGVSMRYADLLNLALADASGIGGGIHCFFVRNLSRQSAGGQTSGGMMENHALASS